jgi:hypothetical protein
VNLADAAFSTFSTQSAQNRHPVVMSTRPSQPGL